MNQLEKFLAMAARPPSLDLGVLRAIAGGCICTGPSLFGVAHSLALRRLASTSLKTIAGNGTSGDKLAITGTAVPFDRLGKSLDGEPGTLVCQRGCFSRSLHASSDDSRVFFNMNPDRVLGRKSAGTAVFYESNEGLQFEVDPPDSSWADDLVTSMDRGDVDGCACVFAVTKARQEQRDGLFVRVVEQASLIACAIVSWPQFDSATARLTGKQQQTAAATFYSPQPGRIN